MHYKHKVQSCPNAGRPSNSLIFPTGHFFAHKPQPLQDCFALMRWPMNFAPSCSARARKLMILSTRCGVCPMVICAPLVCRFLTVSRFHGLQHFFCDLYENIFLAPVVRAFKLTVIMVNPPFDFLGLRASRIEWSKAANDSRGSMALRANLARSNKACPICFQRK